MCPTIEVIIPFRGNDPHRTRALDWLAAHLQWPVTYAFAPTVGEWSKGATLWPAIRHSQADIIVQHDADVWCDGLADAIAAVEHDAIWAVPHNHVLRLTETATSRFCTGTQQWNDLEQPAYTGMIGGGIIVARTEALLDVPVDPRFIGWGQEDESHGMALWRIYGEPWRGTANLIHLWHPPPRIASPADTAARRTGNSGNGTPTPYTTRRTCSP